jgi:hypothetical protein
MYILRNKYTITQKVARTVHNLYSTIHITDTLSNKSFIPTDLKFEQQSTFLVSKSDPSILKISNLDKNQGPNGPNGLKTLADI